MKAADRRTARISLRIRPSLLAALKAKAEREGMPYQTLVGSILHKAMAAEPQPEPEPEPYRPIRKMRP